MDYIVTGKGTSGAVSYRRGVAVEAVRKAVEMIGNGLQEVLITEEETDRVYGPEQFDLLVKRK
jgi:hypothetical protein